MAALCDVQGLASPYTDLVVRLSAGVAAGFNAPISGVFFAVETVLQRQLLAGKEDDSPRGARGSYIGDPSGGTTSGLTVAMVLLASVLAAVASQVRAARCLSPQPACLRAECGCCCAKSEVSPCHRRTRRCLLCCLGLYC